MLVDLVCVKTDATRLLVIGVLLGHTDRRTESSFGMKEGKVATKRTKKQQTDEHRCGQNSC